MRFRFLRLNIPAVTLLLSGLGGCASVGLFPAGPPPEQIPDLEAELAANPGDGDLLWQLGAATLADGDPLLARRYLRQAVESGNPPAEAWLFLGLAAEEEGDVVEAIQAYRGYIETGGPGAEALEGRIQVLERETLRAAAREALEREAELSESRPSPTTVAILPFQFEAEDPSLQPLSRALAEMLITDLSVTTRLQVVERIRIQALLDEMVMGLSGLVEPETATRAGYLMGAGQVVQGRIAGTLEALALDATVVALNENAPAPTVSQTDVAERLLDMEKEIALELYAAMGVTLTPAERAQVNERPTENLQAVLAFGLGLEASDRGDFAEAARQFAQAAQIDPGFVLARANAQQSEDLADAASTSTSELVAPAVAVEVDVADLGLLDLGQRDLAAEAAGTEGVAQRTLVQIILRTGGGQ